MQVKRFVADDMRTVMRIVKEEMGADAVILSNRVVDGKVEILAARDYDESLINKALDQTLVESKPDSAAAYYERAAAERALQNQQPATDEYANRQPLQSSVQRSAQQDELSTADGRQRPTEAYADIAAAPASAVEAASQHAGTATSEPASSDYQTAYGMQDELPAAEYSSAQRPNQAAGLYRTDASPFADSVLEMRDELKSLRAMIQNQQILGEWSELASKHPLRVSLYKKLSELGLSAEVCKYLAKGLDSSGDVEQAMQAALKQLDHQLPIAQDDMLNHGGVYAMVGPTGVGKTTSIAKLAARFAMQHGQRHVALISTDTYRIGAHEQLMTYGRLLGVPVHAAADQQELQQLLHKLHDKKLVLIDTAGMSQRDMGLSEQFAELRHTSSKIKPYLVLSANAQQETLDEVIAAFRKARPEACIITKLDEAASLGGVLSAVLKHRLPLAYISTGQKVPEDIQPARAADMVARMLVHSQRHKLPVEEEFMAAAFASDRPGVRF
jgi:flagellar biosynthesis protein FlhF